MNSTFITMSKKHRDSHPASVASRLIESSLSPCARTWPHSAKVVLVGSAFPFASTSTTENCTEAWSFEVIRRSVNDTGQLSLFQGTSTEFEAYWLPRICGGRKGQQEHPVAFIRIMKDVNSSNIYLPGRSPFFS